MTTGGDLVLIVVRKSQPSAKHSSAAAAYQCRGIKVARVNLRDISEHDEDKAPLVSAVRVASKAEIVDFFLHACFASHRHVLPLHMLK